MLREHYRDYLIRPAPSLTFINFSQEAENYVTSYSVYEDQALVEAEIIYESLT